MSPAPGSRCLLCAEPLEGRPTLRMTIATSRGELSVDVYLCVDCCTTRTVVIGDLLELARRRVAQGTVG